MVRVIKRAWSSHKPKNWTTQPRISQSLLELSFLQQNLRKYQDITHKIKRQQNKTKKNRERDCLSQKLQAWHQKVLGNKLQKNLSPSFSKQKPILILIALTFIFDKLDHVINSKNCYCCFSRKLSNRKFQETTLRAISKLYNKFLTAAFVCLTTFTWIIFTLLIAGSMTPASKLLRTVPFKRSSPMLQ